MRDRKLALPGSVRRIPATVGGRLRELRKEAGLSQRALAQRVGTTASVICRLEDEEYGGHSLDTLRRIAAVFGMRVEVQFIPDLPDDQSDGTGDQDSSEAMPAGAGQVG
jgi:transcriptional regulator with XRE-family HTH domain